MTKGEEEKIRSYEIKNEDMEMKDAHHHKRATGVQSIT